MDPVEEKLKTITECHFNSGKKNICSDNGTIKQMQSFLKQKGHSVTKRSNIIKTMKDMFNCNSESCIYKQQDFINFIGNSEAKQALDMFFKPEGPSLTFDLLSNFNIDDVLSQLEQTFANRNFLHIPYQMRDFEKIGTELATVDLAYEYNNGKRCFGVVLNTDYSTGGGIHWFCLFGDFSRQPYTLEYFNSSGNNPLPEVQSWLQKTKHYLISQLKRKVDVIYTTRQVLQQDQHSCGVWCLCYIWARLMGVSYSWFAPGNVSDKLMHNLRKNLFRHEK